MKLLGPILTASMFTLAAGCTGHEDPSRKTKPQTEAPEDPQTPEPPPPEAPPQAEKVQVAVASVQLQDDCPAAKPAASPKPASMAEPEAMGDAAYEPPPQARGRSAKPFAIRGNAARRGCVQSRVTFSIESEADEALPFAVKAARLRVVDGERTVGEMTTRQPQIWSESKYEPWDQSVAAGGSLQVSYALGSPNWNEVENAIEQPSREPLYVLEFDVEIDGEVRTVVSPVAPRDEPHNIVT